jgi:carboxyl-terminal processing protease
MQHMDEINRYRSAGEFNKNYNIHDAWQALVTNAAKDSIDLTAAPVADKTYLLNRIKAQLARYKWRYEGYYEVMNSDDPAVKKAKEVLKK